MKKLLFQFDTDPYPSVFDTVVGYDGGADHVIGHANVTPETVIPLVEGTIFTRAPKDKKNTAIFVGGSDLDAGQQVLTAITSKYFANFRVSVMLDSNGSNTTAAAGVATIASTMPVAGKNVVILAGTGPVGQRAAVLLSKQGATVSLTSRSMSKAKKACSALSQQYGVELHPVQAQNNQQRSEVIQHAHIVFACGAAGISLLDEQQWSDLARLEIVVDANATPELGIQGVDMMDRGVKRHGKVCWGAIGFGVLKLALHRACIARLFEDNTTVLDAEQIYAIAIKMMETNHRN
ncbi:MAG TPA: methylenetetrahydrofolate dehydrogenase [Crenotrichaceae bacterium]|nr:methylenetetrahydrofolate dehydrogenase [Crenotrichaceae bacterium]